MLRLGFFGLLLGLVVAGCAQLRPPALDDTHIPPYARVPYQRFSRDAAVEIALREWRAFGQPIVVSNQELPFDNERAEGLWQRVGDYWWQGLSFGAPQQGRTGKHDAQGRVFPAGDDENYAWSAVFIDYVMRMAGAGHRFPYSPNHADYIDAARDSTDGRRSDVAIVAERPERYAPQRGDLICHWRGHRPIRFDDLPAGHFPAHCDIVVAVRRGLLDVIGGNVDNSVALRHIPVAADGRVADPEGRVVDPDHPWFVVIRVEYEP